MATMTTREADKAIKSGKAINVVTPHGARFPFLILARDRRAVEGTYVWSDGKSYSGKFDRSDLTVEA